MIPMIIDVVRYSDNGDDTLSLVFVNGSFQCYMLEDEFRSKKVWGETRIPAGTYPVRFRNVGSINEKYKQHRDSRIRKAHRGMLEICDIPNFSGVMFHIGNDDDDTAGCPLTGNIINNNQIGSGKVMESTNAYFNFYVKVAHWLDEHSVVARFHDMDRNFDSFIKPL